MRQFPGIDFVDELDPQGSDSRHGAVGEGSGKLGRSYPQLSDGQFQAALAYYELYPEEIDARLEQEKSRTPEEVWNRHRFTASRNGGAGSSGPAIAPVRFLLDEDLQPLTAETDRGLGLDVASMHEMGRTGRSKPGQLRVAATEERVMVARNRDDFIRLTTDFFRSGEPHPGFLIVFRAPPSSKPERIAHALRSWTKKRENNPESFGEYSIDFLGSS